MKNESIRSYIWMISQVITIDFSTQIVITSSNKSHEVRRLSCIWATIEKIIQNQWIYFTIFETFSGNVINV